jgi:hypothetical protein
MLDRQAMTVPPGDIGSPVSFGRFVAEYDFLERLIQRVAQMEVSIGKGGAVMEEEKLSILVLLLDLAVQIDIFPVVYTGRFTLAEIRPHGEGSLRQFERIFIVFSHALGEEWADIADRSLSVKDGGTSCEKGLRGRFPMIGGKRKVFWLNAYSVVAN